MNETTFKKSTWREQTVTLSPGIVNEIVFDDTTPNHIHFNNLGPGTLYAGLKSIPDTTKYDRSVEPYKEGLLARDTPTSRVLVYVDGTQNNRVSVTSFNGPFNPNVLTSGATVTADYNSDGEEVKKTTIEGHNVPLPSGSNNIGKVVVSDTPPVPEGTNHMGEVGIDTPLPAGSNLIGLIDINSLPAIEIKKQPVRESHHAWEGDISTTVVTWDLTEGGTYPDEDMKEINYLSNDGDTDLYVSFDDTTVSTTPGQGENGVYRLKAGEVLSNFKRVIQKVNMLRASDGTVNTVRILGA